MEESGSLGLAELLEIERDKFFAVINFIIMYEKGC